MANKVILMHQIRSIIQYLIKGFSLRAICRELHMSRKTVAAYTKRLSSRALTLEDLQHLPDAELAAIVYAPLKAPPVDSRRFIFTEHASYFLNELKRTGVTRLLLIKRTQQACKALHAPGVPGRTNGCD